MILDDAAPKDRRELLVKDAAPHAAEVIRAMTADLGADAKEQYRRIPWIWRVAVAAGKRNDAATIKPILQAALPLPDAALADWQVVVIGGGIVNGLSLAGAWPHERIAEIIFNDAQLKARWRHALEQAAAMALREPTPK